MVITGTCQCISLKAFKERKKYKQLIHQQQEEGYMDLNAKCFYDLPYIVDFKIFPYLSIIILCPMIADALGQINILW